MKQYLLFDLDGTLTDPKLGICTCVQYALREEFGIEEPDLDKLEPFIGPPLKDSFMKYYDLSEEQAETAIAKYRERFSEVGLFENTVYEGIPEMLRDLCECGLTLAVASSKPTVYVKRILEHFGIEKYFKAVVGSELDGTRVNKDEVVLEALCQLFGDKPVERDKVYMIGDRKFDAEGARAMGVESVGVTYGYGDMEELKAAKADYIVRSVEELHKFLLRGIDEVIKPTTMQKTWQIVFPFVMFCLIRNLVVNALNLLLLAVGSTINGGSFLFIYNGAGELEGFTGNASTIMSALGFVAGAAFIWKTAQKMIARAWDDMKLLHLWEKPRRDYVLLAMATVGTVLGVNLLMTLVGVVDKSASYQAVMEDQYAAWLPVGLICYGVITPIAEEILFRGIIYNSVKRMFQLRSAMIISAALFGMYHGNTVQGIYAFVMGLLMAYMYEYFGDYRVPVAIHMVSNVLAYILSYTGVAVSWLVSWPVCFVCLIWAVGSIRMLKGSHGK